MGGGGGAGEGGGGGGGGGGDNECTFAQQVPCRSLQCSVLVMVCLLWDVLTNQRHSMIPAHGQTFMAGRHIDRQPTRYPDIQTDRQTRCSQF